MATVRVTSYADGADSLTGTFTVPAFSDTETSSTLNVGVGAGGSLSVIVTTPVSSAMVAPVGLTAVALTENVSSCSLRLSSVIGTSMVVDVSPGWTVTVP